MKRWMVILLAAMLAGVGIFAIFTAIKLDREFYLFDSKFLYPANCSPKDCKDPGGFICCGGRRIIFASSICRA